MQSQNSKVKSEFRRRPSSSRRKFKSLTSHALVGFLYLFIYSFICIYRYVEKERERKKEREREKYIYIYICIYIYMFSFSTHPFSQAYQRTELCAQILRSQSCRTLLVISVFTVGSSFVAFALKYIGIQRGTTSSLPTEGVEFSWLPVCMSTKPSSWA